MSEKSITPEEEVIVNTGKQEDFIQLVVEKDWSLEDQQILIKNSGRSDLTPFSLPSPPTATPLPKKINSIYEHYLNSLEPARSIPLRIEIENCKRRMNNRELRTKPFDSVQLQHYGLVIGRIQSGKTGHLIGMALSCLSGQNKFHNADLNRNLPLASVVIIFTGLIDDLRKQTYDRFCNDISGFDSSSIIIGPKRKKDLTKDEKLQFQLKSFFTKRPNPLEGEAEQLVLILKKNHKVIECLTEILEEIIVPLKRKLGDVIIIDDECDYASMDSNNADQEVKETETTTNKRMRELIYLFRHKDKFKTICWYIGYTATPFSNVLVNPHGFNDQIGATLFPRGFIYPIAKVPVHLDNEFYFNQEDGKGHIFYHNQMINQSEEEE